MGSGACWVFFYEGSSESQSKNEEESEHLEVFNTWYLKLSFEEQLCFVFDTVPSELQKIFWSNTDRDIKVKTKLKLGLKTVTMTQEYVTLLNAAGTIFGKKDDSPRKDKKSASRVPKDEIEAEARARAVFG